ncbi:ABC transporter ATP-binding protein [Demequina aurantiaca]|uniref:ABC transporter ATP-binding protein n=1 Tax=Demequina aurantiaca TaxID=676200 RepID=UPI003D347607
MELMRGLADTFRYAWRAGKLNFFMGFGLLLIQPIALPGAAVGLRAIIDDSLAGEARSAITAAVLVAVLGVVALTAEHFAHIFFFKTAEDMAAMVERDVAALSNGSVGLEHHERAEYADRIALIRREADRAAWGTIQSAYSSVATVVALIITAILLAGVSPWLILLPLAAIPPLLLGRVSENIARKGRTDAAPATRQANHMFGLLADPGPVKEVRTCGLETEVRERQSRAWAAASKLEIRAEVKATGVRTVAQLIFAVAYVSGTLLTVQDAVRGDASVGDVLMVITLAAQVNAQVAMAVVMLTGLQRTSSMFSEIRWIRGVVAPVPDVAQDASVPDTMSTGITFTDVNFAYPGTDDPVLADVNVTIPAGATVAIVGENGAGKSTLVKLLCRFYEPTSGSITVDGTDLRRIPVDEWRDRISAGFQDFAKYEFTAQHVVGLGSQEYIDDAEAVTAALSRARAEDVLKRLTDGLETPVGKSLEGGTELSGGQWQKLALGRAMMRDNPLLLLLDEPTSALDAQAEHNLFEQYALGARRVAQRTGAVTILVSHRFSTVRMADTILVVGDGKIAEAGTHDELVALGGLYADLYALQVQQYS